MTNNTYFCKCRLEEQGICPGIDNTEGLDLDPERRSMVSYENSMPVCLTISSRLLKISNVTLSLVSRRATSFNLFKTYYKCGLASGLALCL